jgi:hypothetical protein
MAGMCSAFRCSGGGLECDFEAERLEIAGFLGEPTNTVEVGLHRALHRLRDLLIEEEDAKPLERGSTSLVRNSPAEGYAKHEP